MFAHARKDKRLEAAVTQVAVDNTPLLTEAFWREIRRVFIVPKTNFLGEPTTPFVTAIQRLIIDYGIPTSSQYHAHNYNTVIEFEGDEPAVYFEAEDKGRVMLGLLLDLRLAPATRYMFLSLYRVFLTLPYEVCRLLTPEWKERPETMDPFAIFHHAGAEANWDALRKFKHKAATQSTLTNETAIILAYLYFRFITRHVEIQDGHMLSLWEYFMNWVTGRVNLVDAVYQLPAHYPRLLHDLARSAFHFRGFLRTYHDPRYDDDDDRSRTLGEYFLTANVPPLDKQVLLHTTQDLLDFTPGILSGLNRASETVCWKEDVVVMPQDVVAAHKMLVDSLNFRDAAHLVQLHDKFGADNASILLLQDVSALDVSRTLLTVWDHDTREAQLPVFAVFPFFSALRRQEDTLLVMHKSALAQTTLLGAIQCCWRGKTPRSRLADTEVQWHILFKEVVLVMRTLAPDAQELFWSRLLEIAFGHAMVSWQAVLSVLRQIPAPHFSEFAFFVAQVCLGEVTVLPELWRAYHRCIVKRKWPFPHLASMTADDNHLGPTQIRELVQLITSTDKYIAVKAKIKFFTSVKAVTEPTAPCPPTPILSLQGDPSAKKLPYHGQPGPDDMLLLEFFANLEYYTRNSPSAPDASVVKDSWFRQLHVLGIDCQWRKLSHVFPVLYSERRPAPISDSLLYSMLKHTERTDLIKCATDISAEGLLYPEVNRDLGALSAETKKLCGIPADMQLDRLSDTNTSLFSPQERSNKKLPQFKEPPRRQYGSIDNLF